MFSDRSASFQFLSIIVVVFLALSVAAAQSTTSNPIFSAPVTYPSGGYYPLSIAVGDVNGDGTPDLAVANLCSTTVFHYCPTNGVVAVLLGNGEGTFQAPVTYDSGAAYINDGRTTAVAIADVNGDGKLDLIVSSTSGLDLLLGNGDGTFEAFRQINAGGNANTIAVADINGDGKLDLLLAGGGVEEVLLGNGDGTFQASSYDSGNGSSSLAVADVNGDGKPDLLVATLDYSTHPSTVGVLLGNGDGTFQAAQAYDSGGFLAVSIAVGDANGDGKPDLIVGNHDQFRAYGFGVVSVLLGNGDGTFKAALKTFTPHALGEGQIALADFDGDGKLDVAIGSGYYQLFADDSGQGYLLLGKGDGTFKTPRFLDNSNSGLAVGDFNRDGKPDLAVGGVTVLLNISPVSSMCHINATQVYVHTKLQYRFTARVTPTPPATGTPTGEVTFWDSAYSQIVLGSGPLVSGKASITVLLSPEPNPQWVKAVYKGDSNFKGCVSPYFAIFQ